MGIVNDLGIGESVVAVAEPVVETPATSEVSAVEQPAAGPVSPDKPKETVPLATFLDEKKNRKSTELQLAEERGRRMALEEIVKSGAKSPEQTIPDASPLDGRDKGDLMTVADYEAIEQSKNEKAQREAEEMSQRDRVTAAQESYQTAVVEYSAEKVGEGLDLQSVINAGEKNLTPGDKLDISMGGKRAIQIAYERCMLRTPELQAKRQKSGTTHETVKVEEPTPVPQINGTPQQADTPARKLVAFLSGATDRV
ncbi:MAG: hypothetical protein Q7T18_06730 [Sedimentisphaerales bacterium]|nr:hypothetical protein [Sedimentisphaerales bacterium]